MIGVLTFKVVVVARPPQELRHVWFLHEPVVPRQPVHILTDLFDFHLIFPAHKGNVVHGDRHENHPLMYHFVVFDIVQHRNRRETLGAT